MYLLPISIPSWSPQVSCAQQVLPPEPNSCPLPITETRCLPPLLGHLTSALQGSASSYSCMLYVTPRTQLHAGTRSCSTVLPAASPQPRKCPLNLGTAQGSHSMLGSGAEMCVTWAESCLPKGPQGTLATEREALGFISLSKSIHSVELICSSCCGSYRNSPRKQHSGSRDGCDSPAWSTAPAHGCDTAFGHSTTRAQSTRKRGKASAAFCMLLHNSSPFDFHISPRNLVVHIPHQPVLLDPSLKLLLPSGKRK